MSDATKISWTDATWSPVTGCTKTALGCAHCFAEHMTRRFWRQWNCQPPPNHFKVQLHPERLDKPLHWRKPRRIFVCSMSDLFHEDVPFEFIDKVMESIHQTPRHTYQILTKRPGRMAEYFLHSDKPRHCYMRPGNTHLGVSCSTQADADKNIPILLQVPAAVRFVSLEPLLGPINVRPYITQGINHCRSCGWYGDDDGDLTHGPVFPCPKCDNDTYALPIDEELDWVIVGCESGPKRRPCKLEWIRSIVQQCKEANVPCFVKQIDTTELKPQGVLGCKVSRNPEEWPEDLRVQEYPE